MLRKLFGLALAAMLSVHGAQAQFVIDGLLPQWGVSFDEVHRELSRDLLDPRSAQYKGMLLVPNENGSVLCGWMNWREESGAYGQFAAFFYRAERGGVREAYISSVGLNDEADAKLQAAGCFTSILRAAL